MSYIPFISTSSRTHSDGQKSHPGCKIAVSSHAPARKRNPPAFRSSDPPKSGVLCRRCRCILIFYRTKRRPFVSRPDSCSGQGLLACTNKRNYRQKGAPRQTEKHWIIAAGRHRGIICGRHWVTTQSLLSNRHRAPGNPSMLPKELLCSILYCHHCGSPDGLEPTFQKYRSPHLRLYLQQKACATAPLFAAVRISTDQQNRRRHSADSLQHSAKASEYKYTSGSRQAVTT